MGLLDKLLQRKKDATEAAQPGKQPDHIEVFDKSGRLISLTKETWRTQVLPGMLSTNRDNPDELYKIIVGTLQDGLPADIAEAAEHLYQTDPNHLRAVCAWASVLLALKRPDEAEQILRSHIERYGEDGYVVTNLAKVYAARDDHDHAAEILWHALELDPNQDMAIGWFAALAHDRGGKKARAEAWELIAALPGSWRAQLWLARNALEARDTQRALAFYRHSLALVGETVPADFLKQMSGDLGTHGRLQDLLDFTEPHFVPELHGLDVRNNLIRANMELGHLKRARQIVNQLRMQPRPDWKARLDTFHTEIEQRGG